MLSAPAEIMLIHSQTASKTTVPQVSSWRAYESAFKNDLGFG